MDAKEFKRGDIERLRDEAQNCAGAGVKWMTITERPEAIAELAKIALAALPSDAAQAPLTDEHILKAFRDAGIRFQYVGARDTVATQITCGSQNAHLMVSAVRALLAAPIATDAAAPSDNRRPAKSHCQNGGDVCLAGNRDGVCCPEDSCDIDDGVRKVPTAAALPDERAAFDAMKHQVLLGYDESGDAVFGTDPVARARATAPQANMEIAGRFVRRSSFGPWIEIAEPEEGSELLYRATAPQATVKGEERAGALFDPMIGGVANSADAARAAAPQSGATLTDEQILCMWRFDYELPRDAAILALARRLLAYK